MVDPQAGMNPIRAKAYLDLCQTYDVLLSDEASASSAHGALDELLGYARLLDLETEGADAAEVWRQVRAVLATEFASDMQSPSSTAPAGFTPKVYLPANRDVLEIAAGGACRDESLSLMVVEDDPELGPAMIEALSDAGHRVVAYAADADTAVSLAALHRIDLAVVDVQLADGTSGVDVARHLDIRWKVPVLFVSGSRNEHLVGFESAVGFIGKPFKAVELVAAVTMATPLLRRGA